MVEPIGQHEPAVGPGEVRGPIVRPEPTDGGAAETEGWWPQPPESEHEPFNSVRRWSTRLAFPLLALAVVLALRGVRLEPGEQSALPRWGWWTLAGLSGAIGLALVRLRHRKTQSRL